MDRPRRSLILVLVLISLALSVALIVPVARLSGVVALETGYQARSLRHQLAGESVVAVLPQLVHDSPLLDRQLDRDNRARFRFTLGDVEVEVLLQDDSAKLPLPLIAAETGTDGLFRALCVLGGGLGLSTASSGAPLPTQGGRWIGCLDDLFESAEDDVLYGTPQSGLTWTHVVSPQGDVVNLRRAPPLVLEALLQDVKPGLGLELARLWRSTSHRPVAEVLDRLELPADVRKTVQRRLATRTTRYSLLVRTRIGSDVRQRYVLCTNSSPPQVLLNWELAP